MNADMIDLYRCIQHRRGAWKVGDQYYDILNREYGTLCAFCDTNKDGEFYGLTNCLWLPPVWSDDGRCLWAWVDWKKHTLFIHSDGLVTVDVHSDSAMSVCHKVPLPEALLRAIKKQEEQG